MSHNLDMAYRMHHPPGLCPPDFKSPSEQSQQSAAPSNPKKRRKTSNANNVNTIPQPPPAPLDLLPPPLTGYGDTVVASNPFDDTPTTPSMNHTMNHTMNHPMNHIVMQGMHIMHNHLNGSQMRGMHSMNMSLGINSIGQMSHLSNRGGGISPMASSSMGGMSPLGNMNQNMSPLGPMGGMSPMSAQNSHIPNNPMGPNSNRSMGSPMSGGPIGSPMNMPMGSPMGSAMGSPLGGPTHINNGPMGPPMHSPIGNSPSHIQGSRLNGNINVNGGPMNHQLSQHGGPNQNSISMPSGNICQSAGPNTSSSNMGVMNQMNHSNLMSQNNIQSSCNANSNSMNSNMMNMNMGPNHMNSMSGNGPQANGPPGMGMFGPKPMPISAGKVYPPDLAMVFNPQNPSAPPIYACGMCHKEINDNDEALFCESGCNFFYHRSCTGLSEMAYQLIHKEVFAEWCCDKCLTSKNIPLVKFKC